MCKNFLNRFWSLQHFQVDFQRHNHYTQISIGRELWGRLILVFFCRSETSFNQKSQELKDCLSHPCIGQNGLKIQGQNVTLDEMYVSGLASFTWTKCHKKVDITYALDNMSQMQGGWTVRPFFGGWYERFWSGQTVHPLSYSLGMQCYSGCCAWVTKYSWLYMRVEVSLGQCVHGQFIIAPCFIYIFLYERTGREGNNGV